MTDSGTLVTTGELTNSGPLITTTGLLSPDGSRRRASTGKLINAHYLKIEYLLDRVEKSTTHYQVLGVNRAAASEKIIRAYHKSVSILHHPYYKVRAAVPDQMLERIDSAFKRVSEAFSVLTHTGLRSEYDRSLIRRHYSPLPIELPEAGASGRQEGPQPAEKTDQEGGADGRMAAEQVAVTNARPAFWKSPDEASRKNRRRCERFKMVVPIMVAGYDRAGGKWQEITKTVDVSRMGVAVQMKRRVRPGVVVHVTLPLPTKLRSHGFSEPGYNMYAIVRRVETVRDGARVVGLEFLGKHPPAGYLHKPWASFRTEKWGGPDRRREPRHDASEQVVIEYLTQSREILSREVAVTENVSRCGARVTVKSAPEEFDLVRLKSAGLRFEGLATVRNQYVGKDNVERLCLQFLEDHWPI
jgi:curved DNA-binding protein CbpA